MQILQNISLAEHSTMRLGGTARYAAVITSRSELTEALDWARAQQLPVIMVGGGSNIVWQDAGFAGLLLINQIKRFEIFDEDGRNVYVTIGAGEDWDSVVERTTKDGLTGIEALSLVPGTAGATPVQNVGAYGQEISQTLTTVEAYDSAEQKFVTLRAEDCAFGYRTSRFKTTDKGRFFITAITLHLMRQLPEPPFYKAVDDYFAEHKVERPTPQLLREAVIAIRSAKLPDPKVVANNGSFFANPVIDQTHLIDLQANYPTMPYWPLPDGRAKIPAAWLIEQAGFKGIADEETGMATWPTQPLVFVNQHARSTADLLTFKQKIVTTIEQKFQITLTQEPELLP